MTDVSGRSASVRSAISALLLFIAANTVPAAAAQDNNPAPPARVVLEDDGESSAVRVLDAAGPLPFPVGVRMAIAAPEGDPALDARLDAYSSRRVPIWLSLPAPDRLESVEPWRLSLQRLLDRHGSALAILEVTIDAQPADVGAFAARIASTEARARRASIRVALGGSKMEEAAGRDSVYTTELAPYIDVLVIRTARDNDTESAQEWLRGVDPEASLVVRGGVAGADADAARLRVVDAVLGSVGTDIVAHAWQSADVLASALQSLTPVAALMTDEISSLDQGAVALQLSIGAQDVTSSLRHRLLFNSRTFATYLLYWGDAAAGPLDVTLTLAVAGKPVVHDLVAGAPRAVTDYSRDPATNKVRARVPLTGRPMVVDFNEDAAQVFVARSDVSADAQLSIGEIIARHQQQQRAQDAVVRNYIARGADAAALPADRRRSRLRRRHREPLFRRRRRCRVGGAVVLGQRVEVGRRTVRRSRCCSRRRCCRCRCSCGSTTATATGSTARSASTATTATSCASSRCASDASLYRGTVWIDREDVRAHPRSGGAGRLVGARRVERRDSAVLAAGGGRRPAGLPASAA